MGEMTKIAWCDATFNTHIGCAKVSAGCANCYAEADMDLRRGRAKWGVNGTRSLTSEDNWSKPLAWDRAALKAGERRRVFCASLADVFEGWDGQLQNHKGEPLWWGGGDETTPRVCQSRPGLFPDPHPTWKPYTLDQVRRRLFGLIVATPRLDWLLLTKRPENAARYFVKGRMWETAEAYRDLMYGPDSEVSLGDGLGEWPPRNVWIGTSVENQAAADKRIPILLSIPARVRFLSCEPLLFLVDLGRWIGCLNWVIAGGESGPKARPCDVAWLRSLRDQCQAAGVPFFCKQLGRDPREGVAQFWLRDSHGANMAEWPEDLRIQEFPAEAARPPSEPEAERAAPVPCPACEGSGEGCDLCAGFGTVHPSLAQRFREVTRQRTTTQRVERPSGEDPMDGRTPIACPRGGR